MRPEFKAVNWSVEIFWSSQMVVAVEQHVYVGCLHLPIGLNVHLFGDSKEVGVFFHS